MKSMYLFFDEFLNFGSSFLCTVGQNDSESIGPSSISLSTRVVIPLLEAHMSSVVFNILHLSTVASITRDQIDIHGKSCL
jgi:hypothetical protein